MAHGISQKMQGGELVPEQGREEDDKLYPKRIY
jgi:hypothetical protein